MLTNNKMKPMYKKGGKSTTKKKSSFIEDSKEITFGNKPKPMEYKEGGKKGSFPDLNKDGKTTFADVLKGRGVEEKMMGGKMEYKKGGKSMKPGGGGRFAKMVSKLKKEGKSEDSAKAIAASAGRKKYGKSRFQEMAAAGRSKKEMGGMAEELEMETEESTEMMEMNKPPKKRKKTNASAAARKRGNKARNRQKRGKTGCWSGECMDTPEI
jgi:hypothetical protein